MPAKRTLLFVVASFLAVSVLSGCATGPARSPMAGPDWSRGIEVGECSTNDLVALYPEPDGQRIHLAWGRIAEGQQIRYAQLDEAGCLLRDVALPLSVRSPHRVQLLPDGEGGLLVCYLSGIGTERRLYVARIGAEGELLAPPVAVSGEALEVDEYVAVPRQGDVQVFWSNNDPLRRGLYHLRLDRTGRLVAPSKLVAEGGIRPSAQVASDGGIHVAWVHEPGYFEENLYYAPFDAARRELGAPTSLARFPIGPKATLYGPVLALGGDRVNVVWSWEQRAADALTEAGEGECDYVTFPLGAAKAVERKTLALPGTSRPAYRAAQGAFAYTQLAASMQDGSALVYMPNPVPGQHGEAALAVAFEIATRTGGRVQVGLVYLAGGAVKGYQIAARGGRAVIRPVVQADERGQLHLAWLEPVGFRRYRVYYAGTSPATRLALGRLRRDDVVAAAYGAAWTLVQSASMFPIAIIWLFLPFVWVMGYYLFRADGELDRRGPRLAMAVAILLYIFSKFFLMPANFMDAAPFLQRLSPAVAGVYVVALPAAILAAAFGALWLYTRRSDARTLLIGYLVFGGTDCLLTFLLYAPGVLGG